MVQGASPNTIPEKKSRKLPDFRLIQLKARAGPGQAKQQAEQARAAGRPGKARKARAGQAKQQAEQGRPGTVQKIKRAVNDSRRICFGLEREATNIIRVPFI